MVAKIPDNGLNITDLAAADDFSLTSDGAVINFGADGEIKLTHVADTGLALKHTATADDKPIVLTLQTGETDMAANDVIGKIAFQAPDEGTGTDAILVSAAIQAVAEGNHSSSSNATSLQFMTGASEAAASKMTLSSAGLLTVSGRIITDDTTAATSTTDGSLQTDGGLSVALDAVIGDDLYMLSDSSVIHFGADSDVTLTHVADKGLTISTATGDDSLILQSTLADNNAAPKLRLHRASGSPADNDLLGSITWSFLDDGGSSHDGAYIRATSTDVSNGSEDASLEFNVDVAGSNVNRMNFDATGVVFNEGSTDLDFRVESDDNTHMLFVDGGNDRIGIGTSSPDYTLHVRSAGSPSNDTFIDIEGNATDANVGIQFTDSGGNLQGRILYDTDDDNLQFIVDSAEKVRITSNSNHYWTRISETTTAAGMWLDENSQLRLTVLADDLITLNRQNDDGNLMLFRQANSTEGTISVSGTTVTYGTFTGSHWSRLADNSKPTILRGTIMDSLNTMMDWYQAVADVAEIKYTAEDQEVIDGKKNVGDVKREAYQVKESIALPDGKSVGDAVTFISTGEDSEGLTVRNTEFTGTYVKEDDVKHVKCKVSDTADSKTVYGVFHCWDDPDKGLDGDVNDMSVAQVGTYIIRVNKDVTVEAGDLLVSNGDGTAKLQDDDIIRSKTVAKVNSNIKVETYDDGSYTVPCTLHC